MFPSPLSQLDESKDFEERKMIRAAMRDLRKRKRGNIMHLTVTPNCMKAFFLDI